MLQSLTYLIVGYSLCQFFILFVLQVVLIHFPLVNLFLRNTSAQFSTKSSSHVKFILYSSENLILIETDPVVEIEWCMTVKAKRPGKGRQIPFELAGGLWINTLPPKNVVFCCQTIQFYFSPHYHELSRFCSQWINKESLTRQDHPRKSSPIAVS